MSEVGNVDETTARINNLTMARSWLEIREITDIAKAPKTIDLGALWGQLFNDGTPNFPRSSETAWGFDDNKEGELTLNEHRDGVSTTGLDTAVSLNKPHTIEFHTEPGYTRE